MARRNFKRPVIDGFYQSAPGEHSLRIPASIRESEAWAALTSLRHDILLDILDVYFHASGWEKRAGQIAKDGFYFTWSQCQTSISQNAFLAARKEILRVGFFASPLERKTGGAMLFMPCAAWRKYRLTEKERTRIEAAHIGKVAEIKKHKDRQRKFFATKTPATNAGAITATNEGVHGKKQPNTRNKCGDGKGKKHPNTRNICGDLLLQSERWSIDDPKRAKELNRVREQVRLENIAASLIPFPSPEVISRLRAVGVM